MSIFTQATVVAELLAERIPLLNPAYVKLPANPGAYVWSKVQSAERELSRRLAVPLEPTEVFPEPPTEAEIAALAGKPFLVEPGYDMPPDFFSVASGFGTLQLRQRPVIAIASIRFIYPSIAASVWDVPANWIRVDHKYGQVKIIPGAGALNAPLSIFTMQAMGAGYNVPHMIRVRYAAGLANHATEYEDVLDLVKRMAMLGILRDAFVAQSGSISADGLSQSLSADISKFEDGVGDTIERLREKLNGPIWTAL